MKKLSILTSIFLIFLLSGTLKAEITASGAVFPVNTEDEAVYEPSSAMAKDGRAVIAWSAFNTENNTYDVKARVFAPGGTAVTGAFIVHEYTAGSQRTPLVSVSHDGNFIVAWKGDGSSGPGHYFRTFHRNGGPISGDIYTASSKGFFSASVIDNSTLVTVSGINTLLVAKKYSFDGSETGYSENISTANVTDVIVKASQSGAFVVLYLKGSGKIIKLPKGTTSTNDIMAKYFDAAGNAWGEILVKEAHSGVKPGVGINSDGAFAVVIAGTDGFTASTYGLTGELLEADKPVIPYPAESVNVPLALNISMNSEGYYTVSWIQVNQDGSRSLMTSLLEFNGTSAEESLRVFGSTNIYETASAVSDKSLLNVWYSGDNTHALYAEFLKSMKLVSVNTPADLVPLVQKMVEEKKIRRRGVGRSLIVSLNNAQRKLDRGKLRAAERTLKRIKHYVCKQARHRHIQAAAAAELKGYLEDLISGM